MSEAIALKPEDSRAFSKDKKNQVIEIVSNKSTAETDAANQSKSKCQIVRLVNPNSEQKKQEIASHFEPLLTALEMQPNTTTETEKVQYYVTVGENEVLNLKDGMQYTLIQTEDNNFQLCETVEQAKTSANDSDRSWSPIEGLVRHDEASTISETEKNLTPSEFSTFKSLNQCQKSTPCQGQGDETGNSILDSSNSNMSLITQDSKNSSYDGQQIIREIKDSSDKFKENLIYPTLGTKRAKIESENCVNFETPRSVLFQQPNPSPISMEPFRFAHPRSRVFYNPDAFPVGVRTQNFGGYRQRRPRQTFQSFHAGTRSTPIDSSSSSIDSSSSDLSLSSPSSNISLCTNTSSESLNSSIEYPRAPNNTPNSGEMSADSRSRNFEPLWLPKVNSQLENMQYYVPVGLRESHNQKERRRRLRIKLACQTLRNLVPGINERTDKATVFEHVVQYLTFIKQVTNNKYDMEFIEKCYM